MHSACDSSSPCMSKVKAAWDELGVLAERLPWIIKQTLVIPASCLMPLRNKAFKLLEKFLRGLPPLCRLSFWSYL